MKASMLKTPAFVVALAILGGSAVGLGAALRTLGLHLTKKPIEAMNREGVRMQLREFPKYLKTWRMVGEDQKLGAEEAEELGTRNTFSRLYVSSEKNDAGKPSAALQIHTAYYTGKIDTVPHVPERCLTAAGTKLGGDTVEVPVPIDTSGWRRETDTSGPRGAVFQAVCSTEERPRLVRMPRGIDQLKMTVTPFVDAGDKRFYAGYFFLANGGTVASAYGVRLLAYKLTDDYAYYMKVQFTSYDAESPEDLAKLAGKFLDEALPDLMRFVPDWIEVEAGRYPPKESEPTRAG